ncbi:MAG: glycerol-3-phosphate acyltransferase [Verrucomicrobia bacterium]|nr:glycerol-3-phosphate acyltransferase [Verrucomicrobiota bacterium]MCF7708657.1 glycerol-3-phosphate acyltransferase [Verrucomicrobiota bacterium]
MIEEIAKITLIVAAGYALGCLSFAYYLVRRRTGRDIRYMASGNAGAKNAGRVLGKTGFAAAFAGDFLKGTAAVALARVFELPAWALIATMLAVVIGHIWPAQLGFQGGKGISTALGAVVTLNPITALILVSLFAFFFILIRRFTLAGLASFLFCPFFSFYFQSEPLLTTGMIALAALILTAHRSNLSSEWRRLSLKTDGAPTNKPSSEEIGS